MHDYGSLYGAKMILGDGRTRKETKVKDVKIINIKLVIITIIIDRKNKMVYNPY